MVVKLTKSSRNAILKRRRYYDLLSKGMCPSCGRERSGGWITCEVCRAKKRLYQSKLTRSTLNVYAKTCRENRRRHGLCTVCGSSREDTEYSICASCRTSRAKRARARRLRNSIATASEWRKS